MKPRRHLMRPERDRVAGVGQASGPPVLFRTIKRILNSPQADHGVMIDIWSRKSFTLGDIRAGASRETFAALSTLGGHLFSPPRMR